MVSHIKWNFLKNFIKGKKQFIRELLQTLISLSLEEVFQIFIHFLFVSFKNPIIWRKKNVNNYFYTILPIIPERESEFKIVNLNEYNMNVKVYWVKMMFQQIIRNHHLKLLFIFIYFAIGIGTSVNLTDKSTSSHR